MMAQTQPKRGLRLIEQDELAVALGVVGLMASIIIVVYGIQSGSSLAGYGILPTLLILAGLTESYTNQVFKLVPQRQKNSAVKKERRKIEFDVLVAIAVFGALSFFVQNGVTSYGITTLPSISSTTEFNLLFYSVMAIAEEIFFRGFLANLLIKEVGIVWAAIADALVFMAYHAFVYGNAPNDLIIVFGAGIVLVAVDYESRRLSTSMLAHLTINIMSVLALAVLHLSVFNV